MEKYVQDKKAASQVPTASPVKSNAMPAVKPAAATPAVAKKTAELKDITKSESFQSKVKDI